MVYGANFPYRESEDSMGLSTVKHLKWQTAQSSRQVCQRDNEIR